MSENRLSLDSHLLLCVEDNDFSIDEEHLSDYVYLKSNFCGRVVCLCEDDLGTWELAPPTPHGSVYVYGNIKLLYDVRKTIIGGAKAIKEFSYNVDGISGLEYVALGEVSHLRSEPLNTVDFFEPGTH
jgi:hypothetical protein